MTQVFLGDDVAEIGDYAFDGCQNLDQVLIPEGLRIMGNACFRSTAIQEIDIPDGVTKIGNNAFANSPLVSVAIPDSVVEFGDGVFAYCAELLSAEIGGGIREIGLSMFWGCTSLENVVISEGVTTIEMNAFQDCVNLVTVKLPASLECISVHAFADAGLEYIVLPENIQVIEGAFAGCAVLQQIVFTGDVLETLNEWTFQGITAVAYYPADNGTWTEDKLLDYGGDLTWVPYTEIPAYNPFDDVAYGAFYYDAVQWAVAEEITNGYEGEDLFGPMDGCTRAQVVTLLWRAAGKPEPTSTENPFVDVVQDSWYYDAVLWAVDEGITKGYGAVNTFCPGQVCTRGEIVTFLYRIKDYEGPAASFTEQNLLGEWTIDEAYTMEYNGKSLFSIFGSAYNQYGCGMSFESENQFDYYIAAGYGGKGTFELDGRTIHIDMVAYETEEPVSFDLKIQTENGVTRLVMDEAEEAIFWVKA